MARQLIDIMIIVVAILFVAVFIVDYLKIKNKSMKDNKRKMLVVNVALAMCKVENRLSTRKLKLELRNQYPTQMWNQYHDGKNHGVTEYFHQLVNEGKFVSIANNGTYQTYASTTMPIVNRKGDTYIPDAEAETAPTVKTHGKRFIDLVKALSKARITKIVNPTQTVLSGGKKRGLYNTKAKRNTVAPTTSVVNTYKTQTRMTNGRFGAKVATPAAAPVAVAPVASVPVTKVVNKTHNVRTISKTAALKQIQDYKGKLRFATFVKQDGTVRTMRFDLIDPNPTSLGYLQVTDLHIAKKKDPKDDGMRNINMQTLKHIKLGKVSCNVR